MKRLQNVFMRHPYRNSLLLVVMGVVLGFAWLTLRDPAIFPITTVRVKGHYQSDVQHHIKQAVMPYLKDSFFSVDAQAIKRRLLDYSWIAGVEVVRRWPDTLEIGVQEARPQAIWNKRSFLNEAGEVFHLPNPDHGNANLPHLQGKIGQSSIVWQCYCRLQALLTRYHLTIAQLVMSERQSVQITLKSGVVIRLGRAARRARLQRFLKAYDRVVRGHEAAIAYVDMRYHNGMAVRMKKINDFVAESMR